jgi:hypothetical protein
MPLVSSRPQSIPMPLVSSQPVRTSDGQCLQEKCRTPECRQVRSRERRKQRKGTNGKQERRIHSEGDVQKPQHFETNNLSEPSPRKPEFELPANRRLYLKASEGYQRRLLEVVLQDKVQEAPKTLSLGEFQGRCSGISREGR